MRKIIKNDKILLEMTSQEYIDFIFFLGIAAGAAAGPHKEDVVIRIMAMLIDLDITWIEPEVG